MVEANEVAGPARSTAWMCRCCGASTPIPPRRCRRAAPGRQGRRVHDPQEPDPRRAPGPARRHPRHARGPRPCTWPCSARSPRPSTRPARSGTLPWPARRTPISPARSAATPDLTVHRALAEYLVPDRQRARPPPGPTRPNGSSARCSSSWERSSPPPAMTNSSRSAATATQTEENAESGRTEPPQFLAAATAHKPSASSSPGVVTGVTTRGVFVQIDKYLADGMIKIADLPTGNTHGGGRWVVDQRSERRECEHRPVVCRGRSRHDRDCRHRPAHAPHGPAHRRSQVARGRQGEKGRWARAASGWEVRAGR